MNVHKNARLTPVGRERIVRLVTRPLDRRIWAPEHRGRTRHQTHNGVGTVPGTAALAVARPQQIWARPPFERRA
jgi:hypothetical protein